MWNCLWEDEVFFGEMTAAPQVTEGFGVAMSSNMMCCYSHFSHVHA